MSIYLNNIRMQIYAANNSHEMQTKSHGIKVINLKKNGRYTKKITSQVNSVDFCDIAKQK